MSSVLKRHAIVVGAGLSGLAAAIALRRARFSVIVLEQAQELKEIGAGIEIAPNASRILKAWNILERIEQHAHQLSDIVIRSYKDGKILSKANMIPLCHNLYNVPHLSVHRADYHSCLKDEAEHLGVQIYTGCSIVNIDTPKASVTLVSGQTYEADIVVGCDGCNSFSREIFLGSNPPEPSGDTIYRVVLNSSEMLTMDKPNLHLLLQSGQLNCWYGPYGHVVAYPLKRDNAFNIVLTQPQTQDVLKERSEDSAIEYLRSQFQKWDPTIRELLEVAKQTRQWNLMIYSDLEKWVHKGGTFLLLGDAAHPMTPYLGQGAAQGIEDAAVLGTLLSHIKTRDELCEAVVMYERLRSPRATEIKQRSLLMKYVHGYPDGVQQQERDRRLLEDEPNEGFPNPWADPVLRTFMWGYDAIQQTEKAWEDHLKASALQ